MQETWVLSLGKEDLLEKGLAAHSSILAWEILWTEEPGGLQSMGLQTVRHGFPAKQQHSTATCYQSRQQRSGVWAEVMTS